MTVQQAEFQPADRVLYVPTHARGDLKHPDCEHGIVTSVGDYYVHVRFAGNEHSKACRPAQLILTRRP